jgi:hypothetical protein
MSAEWLVAAAASAGFQRTGRVAGWGVSRHICVLLRTAFNWRTSACWKAALSQALPAGPAATPGDAACADPSDVTERTVGPDMTAVAGAGGSIDAHPVRTTTPRARAMRSFSMRPSLGRTSGCRATAVTTSNELVRGAASA